MNAVVVGVGKPNKEHGKSGFGRHHVANLVALAPQFGIENVVITRTTKDGADEMAKVLENSLVPVVGEKVSDEVDLVRVLDRYKPGFVSVTSKQLQESYAAIALICCPTLCEKPFAYAQGNGISRLYLQDLVRPQNLGMHLPMRVVRDELLKNREFQDQTRNARNISIHWQTDAARSHSDLMNDLALHPWSLFPQGTISEVQTTDNGNYWSVHSHLHIPDRKPIDCEITISHGVPVRAMGIDDVTYYFGGQGKNVDVSVDPRHISVSLIKPEVQWFATAKNPLLYTLERSLNGAPVVPMDEIMRSQTFLERVHGWKNC